MAMRLSGLVSGMDTEAVVAQLMQAHRLKTNKVQNKITTTEWKQDRWSALNSKIYSLYTGQLSKLRMQGSFAVKKATSSNINKVEVLAGANAPEGNHLIKIKQLAGSQFVTGSKLDTDNNGNQISTNTKLVDLGLSASGDTTIHIKTKDKQVNLDVGESTTIGEFVNSLKNAGLNANYDVVQKRLFISSKDSGSENAFEITASSSEPGSLANLGLGEIVKDIDGSTIVNGNPEAVLVQATDAIVIYNGAELKGSSNNFSVNGLTLTLKGVTAGLDTAGTEDDEVISISVAGNTEAVYDMVKDFIKTYNELLKEMNEAYNAESSRGYDPLTEEERAMMTEEQITKWEDKIKNSLLRRDNILGGLIDVFRSTLNEGVAIDGKTYSLSSFGITTQSYSEKGLLHINGDEDYTSVATLNNKLMDALTNNPDEVMSVMTKLADNLYNNLMDKMKSTSLSSALTIYNDKEMSKTLTNYKSDLAKMEAKLQDIENRYFKQFAAMETAMANMNSQSSALMSMLGMNNNQNQR